MENIVVSGRTKIPLEPISRGINISL